MHPSQLICMFFSLQRGLPLLIHRQPTQAVHQSNQPACMQAVQLWRSRTGEKRNTRPWSDLHQIIISIWKK